MSRLITRRPMPEIDEQSFDTFEEAVAFALKDSPPGCVVAIHEPDCQQHDEDETKCTCLDGPLELTVGAQA